MSLLNPITLLQACSIVGEALGLKVSEDKPEIIKYINKYRELIYTMYEEFKLFDNVFHCMCVTSFKQVCAGECHTEYQGFTLPSDILSVEAIWNYGKPLTLHSRWRESHTGLGIQGCSRISAIEMAETFPTERDIQKFTSLRIFTEREEDENKCVKLSVLTTKGQETTLIFRTVSDGWAVSKVKVKKILSVSLPPDRVGSITLAQQDGFLLSKYTPWESVPNYRRYKVASNCCKGTVIVQGVRSFKPIYFDEDIVEVGNSLVIEAAAKYFKFGENTADGNEINVANAWRNEMRNLLNGLISRHRGNAIQDGPPLQFYRVRNKSLPGYCR